MRGGFSARLRRRCGGCGTRASRAAWLDEPGAAQPCASQVRDQAIVARQVLSRRGARRVPSSQPFRESPAASTVGPRLRPRNTPAGNRPAGDTAWVVKLASRAGSRRSTVKGAAASAEASTNKTRSRPFRSSACSTWSWKSVRHSTPGSFIASTASTNRRPERIVPAARVAPAENQHWRGYHRLQPELGAGASCRCTGAASSPATALMPCTSGPAPCPRHPPA